MIVVAPDGRRVLQRLYHYLPHHLRDILRLQCTSSIEPVRHSDCRYPIDSVIFKANNWEVVAQIEEELAMMALDGS